MKLIIINGPNLNLLGEREPEIYGSETLEQVNEWIENHELCRNLELEFFQSNSEGELIDFLHSKRKSVDYCILNAGALTHTSIGLLDALNMFKGPKIELHITNIYARESFRHKSYISPVVNGMIAGFGFNSYLLAIDAIKDLLKD